MADVKQTPEEKAKAAEAERLQEEQRKAAEERAKNDDAAVKAAKKDNAKSAGEQEAAKQGADAVVGAFKKVADAAVAELQKLPRATPGGIDVSGVPGGRFTIYGDGFGASGTVKFGGVQVETTGWSNERIKGLLPSNVAEGEVVVHVDDETERKGYFKP